MTHCRIKNFVSRFCLIRLNVENPRSGQALEIGNMRLIVAMAQEQENFSFSLDENNSLAILFIKPILSQGNVQRPVWGKLKCFPYFFICSSPNCFRFSIARKEVSVANTVWVTQAVYLAPPLLTDSQEENCCIRFILFCF